MIKDDFQAQNIIDWNKFLWTKYRENMLQKEEELCKTHDY